MNRRLSRAKRGDFGARVAEMLPIFIREFAKRQIKMCSETSLSVPQFAILDILAARGSCKMSELAETLNLTLSAVTVIIDKMIKMKLVKRERSGTDRRVVNVSMVAKGKELASRIRSLRRNIANDLFSPLGQKDKNEYIRILGKVCENVRKRT